MITVRRCRLNHGLWRSNNVRAVVVIAVALFRVATSVQSAFACGYSADHFYTYAYSSDIANTNGNGAQAAWEEQNYDVADYTSGGSRFVDSEMWLMFSENPLKWVEVGFIRSEWCPGNCFFRAAGDNSTGYFDIKHISKAPQGAHTWHVFKIASSSGKYYSYIDGTQYGGYGGFASSAESIRIGDEITSNCSTVNITYWGGGGSPSTSSSYAFQYRTSRGQWTTWGSGGMSTDYPYRQEWLTYAIYQRTWGP